jgi:hypothetical protein
LLPQARRADYKQTPTALCPVLTYDERGFDGLTKTNFIGQQYAHL